MRKALVLVSLAIGAAFVGGYLAHTPHTVTVIHTVTQDDVQSFNDGWMTALHGDGK